MGEPKPGHPVSRATVIANVLGFFRHPIARTSREWVGRLVAGWRKGPVGLNRCTRAVAPVASQGAGARQRTRQAGNACEGWAMVLSSAAARSRGEVRHFESWNGRGHHFPPLFLGIRAASAALSSKLERQEVVRRSRHFRHPTPDFLQCPGTEEALLSSRIILHNALFLFPCGALGRPLGFVRTVIVVFCSEKVCHLVPDDVLVGVLVRLEYNGAEAIPRQAMPIGILFKSQPTLFYANDRSCCEPRHSFALIPEVAYHVIKIDL